MSTITIMKVGGNNSKNSKKSLNKYAVSKVYEERNYYNRSNFVNYVF